VLYADSLVLVCRQQHPALSEPLTMENLRGYEHSSFMTEGQSMNILRQRLMKFPGTSDQLQQLQYVYRVPDWQQRYAVHYAFPPVHLLRKCWPLESIRSPS
jgi:DNA-binding transcriptional LysR family regulator